MIQRHNCGDHSWKIGINDFMDHTEEELAALRGYRRHTRGQKNNTARTGLTRMDQNSIKLPESISWGHLESIREDKNQGSCGSCWAFSADTVMRAHAEINNRPHRFSVAQLIACTPNPRECGGK